MGYYEKQLRIFKNDLLKSKITPYELAKKLLIKKIKINKRTVERWYSGKLPVPRNDLQLIIWSIINPVKYKLLMKLNKIKNNDSKTN